MNVKISMGSTRIQSTGTHLIMRFFQNDASKKLSRFTRGELVGVFLNLSEKRLFNDRYCMLWPFLIFLWPLIIFLINLILCPKMSWFPFEFIWNLESSFEIWKLDLHLKRFYPILNFISNLGHAKWCNVHVFNLIMW